jgi:predicted alpha/beta-fold hydrolase
MPRQVQVTPSQGHQTPMPRKIAKLIRASLLCTAGLLIVVVAAGLSFRAYRQDLAAAALAIRSPNGVQEGGFVVIGNIKQWVQTRGEDRNNPVLLFVHGGPGGSTLPMSSGWQPWEKYFTVVQWDQRGAGRTYGETGDATAPTMTLERMTQDGIELRPVYSHLQARKSATRLRNPAKQVSVFS